MACGGCERRRRALEKKRAQKERRGQRVQAAAIGAVLSVTEAAGKALGLTTRTDDGRAEAADRGARPDDDGAEPDS